jgi:hypothetical protein
MSGRVVPSFREKKGLPYRDERRPSVCMRASVCDREKGRGREGEGEGEGEGEKEGGREREETFCAVCFRF